MLAQITIKVVLLMSYVAEATMINNKKKAILLIL